MTDARLTEAELAELRVIARRLASRFDADDLRTLQDAAPRLIAVARLANDIDDALRPLFPALEEDATTFDLAHELARLANEQAERIAELERNTVRATDAWEVQWRTVGEHREELLTAERQLAQRDATIERLESECDSMRRRWYDLERIQDRQLTFDSVAMELADSEEKRRLAAATIERLTKELERFTANDDEGCPLCGDLTYCPDCKSSPGGVQLCAKHQLEWTAETVHRLRVERDAARAALEKAKGLIDDILCAVEDEGADELSSEAEWRARRAELDRV